MENLLCVWGKFLCGKRSRKDVIVFGSQLADNLAGIHKSLIDRTYEHGAYHAFNISDPKPRNIHKASVRDRVVHHLVYKELYPYFDLRFIHDSYSCRKNKGTHKALNRFRYFARKVSKNHTRTCFVLKCDIRKFFASIDHEILKKILLRHSADPDILWLLDRVIDSFQTNHLYSFSAIAENEYSGLPLGNLTSQLLVNVYMHEFDMYIKQELKVKYYIRYADDFVMLSGDKKYLEDILLKFQLFLSEKLKLSLHENKTYIQTFDSGVDFLGWTHFPHHRQVRTTTKNKILRRMKGYPKPETVNSYRGLLIHGDTHLLQKRLKIVD